MRDAVLRDFAQISDVEIIQTCDARFPRPPNAILIDAQADVWAVWADCMTQADAVLLIAPETSGFLSKLTALAEGLNKAVLGSTSKAIQLASDKWLTYQALKHHQIPTIPTYLYDAWPQDQANTWVAKPIDGAGCEDMAYFEKAADLAIWMQTRKLTHLIQPYQKGRAASFSMWCKGGEAYLLCCNYQKIMIAEGMFNYTGGVINGALAHQQPFDALAKKIAKAMPELAGYIGVDVIVEEVEGVFSYYVVEVNPRITTSYVALHEACGLNPARMMLDLFYNEAFKIPAIAHNKVDISLNVSK